MQLLEEDGIRIGAHIQSVGEAQDTPFDPLAPQMDALSKDYLTVLDEAAGERMAQLIDNARLELDSVGGIIECAVTGLPVGLGQPMFDGIENVLSKAIFGIPAIRGIEFGSGFESTKMRGSEHNDPFVFDEQGKVVTASNRHNGVLGGLATGMPLIFRVAVKPTASIFLSQQTVNLNTGKNAELSLKGRHDPCIVPRAVPVVEAVAALAIYDLYLDYLKEKNYGAE